MKWYKIYLSPFKPIIPKLYIGKIAIGTPYFYPRRWKKLPNGNSTPIPKKIGFDFVGLGWKTKWSAQDYRHEWNPVWSFVFFKWQIAIIFRPEHDTHYWECWLTYHIDTDKGKKVIERLQQAQKLNPCVWSKYISKGKYEEICYWDYILKDKYLKKTDE